MILILFMKAEQLGLFDMPVQVAGSVDKHGHVRAPHVRIQKVRLKEHHQASLFEHAEESAKPERAKKSPKLDKFLAKHGGPARMADSLKGMTPEQRGKLIDAMAHLDGLEHGDVLGLLGMQDEVTKGTAPVE